MPATLQAACAGDGTALGLRPDEVDALVARWDREGGPLRLQKGVSATLTYRQAQLELRPCLHLGPWTGRLCHS